MRPRRLAALAAMTVGLTACVAAPPAPGDGTAIPRRSWVPDSSPRAVILATHGFNDYSNAFAEFGAFAAERGVVVHAYDQSGFGANPNAGWWPGTPALVTALRDERDRVAARYPDAPIYLLGESMGAAVIMAAAAEGEAIEAAGTILSAPAVWGGDQLNPFYRATLWLAVRLMPGLKLTGRGLEIKPSDNIDMLRALGADPLVIKGTRVDAVAGLVELMDVAYTAADTMPAPLLVLGGARDEIVPPGAHLAMLERVSARPCTEIIYPDGYHMLLRDMQRRVVWRDILAWIGGQTTPSALAQACRGPEVKPVVASLE